MEKYLERKKERKKERNGWDKNANGLKYDMIYVLNVEKYPEK